MTTPVIATVVEGHGEVQALPVLLRRLAERNGAFAHVPTPFRLDRHRIVDEGHLSKAVSFVARRSLEGGPGGVLVLADADDDCPVELANRLLPTCLLAAAGRRVEVVVANREYESWLLAGAFGLIRHRDVTGPPAPGRDYESIRDAKGQLGELMSAGYSPTRHQPGFTALFDLDAAATASRSFRHLLTAVGRLLA